MDRIMPVDIERMNIRRRMFGYDRKSVDHLMAQASKTLEEQLTEIKQLREENERQKMELATHRAQESTLKEALILAQKTADETRAAAHKEAELILEEARRSATERQQELQTKINDLRWELERLRLDKQKFLRGFRGLLEDHLRELAEHEPGQLALIEGEGREAATGG
jgi:cell division initiation protein